MVSQSKSTINVALCLVAMLAASSTTNAQLSTVPKRYRSGNNKPQEFGRQQRQQTGKQQKNTDARRKMEDADVLSMPILTPEMSMPTGEETIPDPAAPAKTETVDLDTGSSSDGTPYIAASFAAGVSALVIGGAALYVKKRRDGEEEAEEDESECAQNDDDSDNMMRVVNFASYDDWDDEEEGQGMDIILT